MKTISEYLKEGAKVATEFAERCDNDKDRQFFIGKIAAYNDAIDYIEEVLVNDEEY